MKKILINTALLVILTSCAYDEMRLSKPEELGTETKEYIVDQESGGVDIIIYANMAGTVSVMNGAEWVSLSSTGFDGDAVVHVDYTDNSASFRRMAEVLLESPARRDTVFIMQEGGIVEEFSLAATSVVMYNGNGGADIDVTTNIPVDEFFFKVDYNGKEKQEWIGDCSVEGNILHIPAKDNAGSDMRNSRIVVSYVDGWKQTNMWVVNVTQASVDNKIGDQVSFEELREMTSAMSEYVGSNITLEGYVVSDKASGNVGDNVNLTNTTIDYAVCEKTAYMESADGKYGVMLEFSTAENNLLENNTRVLLNLRGARIMKFEDPDRYIVSGLSSSNILSSIVVDDGLIPAKVMSIKDIKDSDIYTRVTLKDCEFPVRKGSLTPVNEGYTSINNTHRIGKFPSLIRCKDGGSMYMYTNTTCPYRRDGQRLGYGSGNVTGIIVHEKYRRFIDGDAEEEENCGTIGRYQIRHMSREDIGFSDSFEDGFSEMICEWRYLKGNSDGSLAPTYGAGSLDHSFKGTTNTAYKTHAWPINEFSYLGPVTRLDKTNVNAFGLYLEDGTNYGADYEADNIDKGVLPANSTIALSWMREAWWNNTKNAPEYWVLNFSTSGISTDQLSLQISTVNFTSVGYSPIQWKIEWAESDTESTEWKEIAKYSVPDIVQWNATQFWQSAGYKPINFELPLEMLGKSSVYIRFIPRNRIGSTLEGYCDTEYKNGSAGTTNANNALNYVAVRYNK